MAPHTGLRLGYLFLSPFAYEPVRWLKLAKAPAVKPEFKSCGRDRRSESSLPSCPLSSALHRRVHAFASAPMKRISTCQSPPTACRIFLSIMRVSIHSSKRSTEVFTARLQRASRRAAMPSLLFQPAAFSLHWALSPPYFGL